MASSFDSRPLKYTTDYSTHRQGVVDRMNDIYYFPPIFHMGKENI